MYTTNKKSLANDVGRRLENFFWRIWSNGRIRDSIKGSSVAALFIAISDGDAIIRTTPTSSPRSSRLLPALRIAARPASPPPINRDEAAVVDDDVDVSSAKGEASTVDQSNPVTELPSAPTVEEEKGRRRGSSRPPPILKKTRTESTKQESKTARILTPTWKTPRNSSADTEVLPRAPTSISFDPKSRGDKVVDTGASERSKISVYDLGSSSAAAAASSSSLSGGTPSESFKGSSSISSKSNRKKPSFIAGATSSKRRPVVVRRKSSQSSSSNVQSSSSSNSKAPSPRIGSQGATSASPPPPTPPLPLGRPDRAQTTFLALTGTEDTTAMRTTPNVRSSRPTSRSVSPVTSGPFHRPSRDHMPDQPDLNPAAHLVERGQLVQLVDRDFRIKFADKFRPENHPFAVLKSKSSVGLSTTPAQGPSLGGVMESPAHELRPDKGKGKAKAADRDTDRDTLKPSAKTSGTDDKSDRNESTPQLPRTKSQLTFLLEKDKRLEQHKAARRQRGRES